MFLQLGLRVMVHAVGGHETHHRRGPAPPCNVRPPGPCSSSAGRVSQQVGASSLPTRNRRGPSYAQRRSDCSKNRCMPANKSQCPHHGGNNITLGFCAKGFCANLSQGVLCELESLEPRGFCVNHLNHLSQGVLCELAPSPAPSLPRPLPHPLSRARPLPPRPLPRPLPRPRSPSPAPSPSNKSSRVTI